MYTSLFYNSGITPANLLSDAVALCTGETNVNNLSTSCDKVNTVINTSSNSAGWTIHDNSAGTNAICLKAPISDNETQFKYVVIDTNSTGYIYTKVYETWDSGTHTGTNICYGSNTSSYAQRISTSTAGRLEFSTSNRKLLLFSYQSNVYGCSSGNSFSGCLERTRLSPWDIIANGFPPFGFLTGTTLYLPRRVNLTGAEVTSSTTVEHLNYIYSTGSSLTAPPSNTVICDSTKTNFKHAFYELGCNNVPAGSYGGNVSSLCDIYLTTQSYGSAFDNIFNGTDEYIIWNVGNTRYAIRKG